MIITNFIGGQDVQRSLNHSDNLCTNLVPSLNDKGDIAAFYTASGLTQEADLGAVAAGIYTASNGRCFEVVGTTLYELTDVAGVITPTSRGTVTSASVYRMSDNGIEMILVNGTDGWLFTFATNGLKKIKVAQADFTVTIANPAVFTKTAHGLVAGDPIRLATTYDNIISDTILASLNPSVVSTTDDAPKLAYVAPGNDFVYTVRYHNAFIDSITGPRASNAVVVRGYSRNTTSGVISPLSSTPLSQLCTHPEDVVMSSDGAHLYIVGRYCRTSAISFTDDILHYTVNVGTGAVAQAATFYTACGSYPKGVVVADGYMHVANSAGNTISSYSIGVGTGDLTPLVPATTATGSSPQKLAYSNDGAKSFLYCSNGADNTISQYEMNQATGLLTPLGTPTISCGGVTPARIRISPDKKTLYCVNSGSNDIAVFSRNTTTGLLTFVEVVATGTYPLDVVIAPDNASVYVSNATDNTVSMFVRDTSTGALTPAQTATIATGNNPHGLAISTDGKSVYAVNSAEATVSQYGRNATSVSVGLPSGLSELTTYYVIASGLTADTFQVSATEGGTAVSTSGQQAGVHTYTTLGYGFPNGAKTVSYMNGRFVALLPNTQEFYVSEVLDGKWWDALNVQTVDSNPDNVVGEIVSHNELIVFCENSGETFYDSGVPPAPFVRNASGIFEVGCAAPYSIVNLDNQVFWLGKNQTGQGVIYRLQGFTPVRVSTYSIEYALQQMSTVSDAVGFAYQLEGHHFYVITFPTGDRTFVYDLNTGLWHERGEWNGTAYSRWNAKDYTFFAGKHLVPSKTDGKLYSLDNGVYAYGANPLRWVRSFTVPKGDTNFQRHSKMQIECEVGEGITPVISGGSVQSITMTNNGTSTASLTMNQTTLPTIGAGVSWSAIGNNGSRIVALTQNSTISATSDDGGLTWTQRSLPASTYYPVDIAWNGSIFVAVGFGGSRSSTTGTNQYLTSSDGITWTARTLPATLFWTSIAYGAGVFIAVGYLGSGSTSAIYSSADGINWTLRDGTYYMFYESVVFNGSLFVAVGGNTGGATTTKLSTSTDGITWTQRNTMPVAAYWMDVAWNGSVLCAVAGGSANTIAATSTDGITWTQRTLLISAAWGNIVFNGTVFFATNSASNDYQASADGITWTSGSLSGTSVGSSALTVLSGSIVSIPWTLTSSLGNYSTYTYPSAGTYALTFTGGAGAGAAGTYTISPTTGQITSTAITNNGSGYTSAPSVSFLYGGISGASGTANMSYVYSSGTPSLSMRYSDDGGKSWSTPRTASMGSVGQYGARVTFNRLGAPRNKPRLYELSGSDDAKTTLINVHLE